MKQSMQRIGKDEYFMNIARVVSTRSTCDRAHVGAILVKNSMIISTGYNGSPRSLPHCSEEGHFMENGHCTRTVHAEVNAIIQAAYNGISTNQASLYTTHFPCRHCLKFLINSGILQVFFSEAYKHDDQEIEKMLTQSKMELVRVNGEKNG